MKNFLWIFIIIIIFTIFSISSAEFRGFGRSVQMDFAFHINDSKVNDEISNSTNYILVQDNVLNITAGLIFSGSESFGTNYSSTVDDYIIQLKQSLDKNRFYLVFTNATKGKIESKLPLSYDKILQKTFADFSYIAKKKFPLFIRLEYTKINLNKVRFGKGEILIKNEGIENGLTKIRIEVLR